MLNPENILLHTAAFDTLKNDDDITGTVTLPGSASIAAAGRQIVTTDVTVGTSESILDTRTKSSKAGSQYYLASVILSFTRTGSLGAYSVFAHAYHTSATNVRLEVFATNPYGLTLTTEAGDETFTFKLRTYKDPFAS